MAGKRKLRAPSYAREEITALVPTWCEDLGQKQLFVRELSGAALRAYRDSLSPSSFDGQGRLHVERDLDNAEARLLVLCVVDANGGRVFEDADAPMVGEEPAPLLEAVYAVALRVNRMRKEDEEELEKNSTGKSRASSAGSPATSAGNAASNGVCESSAVGS